MTYIVNVSFHLTGDFEPAQMSARLGIMPDETRPKGVSLRSGIVLRESEWIVETRLPSEEPLEGHLRDVLARLAPAWGALREMAGSHAMVFTVFVQDFDERRPLLSVAPDVTTKMAELNAALAFDLY